MNYILSIILLCLTFWVFFQKGESKILPFFIYAICLSGISPSLYPKTLINMPIFFFLSMLLCWKSFYKSFNDTILWWLMLLMLLATIVLWIHSPHYGGLVGAFRLIKTELIEKYLIICYAFYIFKNRNSLRKIIVVSYYCLIILTFFGFINLLSKHAIFVDWALEGADLNLVNQDMGGKYQMAERFRVMAMHPNPFSYGFVCTMLLLLFVYGRDKKIIEKMMFYFAVFCCLFGIITCGCRTIVIIAVIGLALYYLLTRGIKKSFVTYIFGISLFALVLANSSTVTEKFNFFVTIFNENSNVSASSDLNLRSVQMAAVQHYTKNDFLYGLGKDFFYIDMDYKSGRPIDKDLGGLEGVYLNLLLERGLVGLVFYVTFWVALTLKVFLSRKKNKMASAFGLSVIIAYLVFSIMTGELNSAFFTLLLCGFVLAEIYKEDRISKIVILRKTLQK